MRMTPDTELTEAADKYAKAEAMCAFAGAVRAAEAAAEGCLLRNTVVPPVIVTEDVDIVPHSCNGREVIGKVPCLNDKNSPIFHFRKPTSQH
ncbi:unnamed protein product [Acanthoscelides obtectus]|nr:unnamed protein product [Acanthoscelides obtectus]CAK1663306.1 hypothetical protein AOBTE_LOCUS23603 [Acanthoscelides obtectus]